MAEDRNLNVSITSTNAAGASLKQLEQQLATMLALQNQSAAVATAWGTAQTAAFDKVIASIKADIAASVEQESAVRRVTAAIREQIAERERAAAIGVARSPAAMRTTQIERALGPDVERQLIDASMSAKTFASSLSVAAAADAALRDEMLAGGAVTVATGAQFKTMVEELTGVRTGFLSASESAAVFERELGTLGGAVVTTTNRGLQEIIRDNTMLSASFKSAAESAAVFRAALPEIGAGLTLTPAAGFSRMVADLAGVKTSLLSARESAAVFSAGLEDGAIHAQAGTAGVSREIKHVVAAFDELSRGQRGAFFSTLGAAARDAGFGVNALVGSMGGLIAILAVGAVVRGAENLGKWAEQAQAAAAATGMSVNQFTRLDGAMQLLGGKVMGSDEALRGFAKTVAQAVDPTSKSAQALNALQDGLAKAVVGAKDNYTAFLLVADAWSRASDSANKAAAGQVIFRQGLERVEPLLARAATGTASLGDKAQMMGHTLNDTTAPAAAKTAEKIRELGESVSGKANQAFLSWGPTIESSIGLLDRLGSAISVVVNHIGNLANQKPPSWLSGGVPFIRFPFSAIPGLDNLPQTGAGAVAPQERHGPDVMPQATHVVGPIIGGATFMEQEELKIASAREKAAAASKDSASARVNEEKAVVAVLQEELALAQKEGLPQKDQEQLAIRLANAKTSLRNTELSQEATGARKSYEEFASAERLKITEADKDAKAIAAIYEEWLAQIKSVYGRDQAEFNKVQKEKIRAAQEFANQAAREQMRAIRESASDTAAQQRSIQLGGQLTQISRRGAPGAGGAEDMAAQILSARAAIQEVLALGEQQIAQFQAIASAAGVSADVQKEAEREVVRVWDETAQKIIEIDNKITAAATKAARDSEKVFTEFFTRAANESDSFAKALGAALIAPHTQTQLVGIQYQTVSLRTQEIRQAFAKLVTDMSSNLFDSVTNALSRAIAQSLGAKAGEGLASFIGEKLGSLFTGVKAPTANALGLTPDVIASFNNAFKQGTNIATLDLQKFNDALTQATTAAQNQAATTRNSASGTSNANLSQSTVVGFNNALKQGTTTVTTDLVNFDNAVVMATTALRNMSSAGGGGGSGGGGSSSGSGSVQQTIQTGDEQAAARSDTQTMAQIGALQSMGSLVASAVGGSAGQIISGIVGVLGLILNALILLNIKPSALGFSYAGGGIVSAAGGMVVGGMSGTQLAVLHDKEMVLPSHISTGLQNMISSGSGGGNNFAISFNVSANDAAGVNAFFQRNGPALATSLISQIRANNTSLTRAVKGLA